MSRYLLVPVTGAESDGPVFTTALMVARIMPAHLAFLHVRLDVQATLTAMASADTGGALGYTEMLETLEQEAAARQKKAELAFRDFCESERLLVTADLSAGLPSADWRTETGDEPHWVAEHGRVADLVVVGRSRDGEAVAIDILEAALMGTAARSSSRPQKRVANFLVWLRLPGRTGLKQPVPSQQHNRSCNSPKRWSFCRSARTQRVMTRPANGSIVRCRGKILRPTCRA